MYYKIERIGDSMLDTITFLKSFFKISLILGLALIFCLCVLITYKHNWNTFSYPEEAYNSLEIEAYRLSSNHTFDTEFHYTVTNYDSESKVLIFDLINDNATITVTVNNYNDKDESVDIKRATSNTFYTLRSIFLFIIIGPMLIAMILVWIISLLFILIFWPIAYFLHRIIEHFKNKNEPKKMI